MMSVNEDDNSCSVIKLSQNQLQIYTTVGIHKIQT